MRKLRFIPLALSLIMILLTVSSPIFATPTDLEVTPKNEFNPRIYIRTDKPILSEMTAEEQFDFLVEAGVEIPEFVQRGGDNSSFIAAVIKNTEIYPNFFNAISYSVMYDFGNAIRDAVNAYYGREALLTQLSFEEQLQILADYGANISEKNLESYADFIQLSIYLSEIQNRQSIVSNPVADEIGKEILDAVNAYYYARPNALETLAYVRQQNTSSGWLVDSSTFCNWETSFLNYNCYAYAVGRTDSAYWPGKFSTVHDSSNFDLSVSIATLAGNVASDLRSSTFSQNCVTITTTRPTSLEPGEKCICIRKGSGDFHFMKMESSSEWRHKPGRSIPLKYKYLPSNDQVWSNEAVIAGSYFEPTQTYDSTIYYIIYKSNHVYSHNVWTGNHYHSGNRHYYEYADKCSCGDTTAVTWIDKPCIKGNCALPWSIKETQ